MVNIFRTVFLTISSLSFNTVSAKYCTSYSTGGQNECVLLHPYYSEYQYATCLSNNYIRLKSEFRHACRKRIDGTSPNYCWYQCMLELNGIGNGPVYKNCKCDPLGGLILNRTTTVIPRTCSSPTGSDCSWYKICLQKKYNCHQNTYNEFISLGSKLCDINRKIALNISNNATRWLKAARKCFQIEMTPLLKPWLHVNCSHLDSEAKTVRGSCLRKPFGVIDICDLSAEDLWALFWTVKETYDSTFSQNLVDFAAIAQSCFINKTVKAVKKVKLSFSKNSNISLNTAVQYVNKLSCLLDWDRDDVLTYGEFDDEITLLITTRKDIGLKSTRTTLANLDRKSIDNVLGDLVEAAKNGETLFRIDKKIFQLESMYVCSSIDCENIYLIGTATYAELNQNGNKTPKSTPDFAWLGICAGVVIILICGYGYYRHRKSNKTIENNKHWI